MGTTTVEVSSPQGLAYVDVVGIDWAKRTIQVRGRRPAGATG
jgi:hypothetical protein